MNKSLSLQKILATLLTVAALVAGQNAWAQNPQTIGSISYNSTLGAYEINSVANLNDLAVYVNGTGTYSTDETESTAHNCSGLTFKMTDNITYTHTTAWNDTTSTENNFTAIGGNDNFNYFSGHFDGDGHTISGIRIYKDGTINATDGYQGLFGNISGFTCTIQKVTLTDARITGKINVGGIVGNVNSSNNSVSDCHVTSTVAIHAVVSQATMHGGIAGMNSGTVSGCTSAATVSVAYGLTGCNNYGGIVGRNFGGNATVSNCLAICATVDGNNYAGAIVGSNISNLTSNYYRNCIVNGNTTNVGTEDGDVEGARGIGILTTTTGVTATGETEGTVVIDNTTYHYGGQTITFTYSGEIPEGHFLGIVTANGGTIEVTAAGNDTYTFTMPAEDITAGTVITWSGLQTLLTNASTDEENPTLITLYNDVVAASTDSRLLVTYNKHVIIDLNGYAIDRHLSEPALNGEVIYVRAYYSNTQGAGHLTIRDSSNPSTGRITGGYALTVCGGVQVAGFFTLESGSICGNKTSNRAAGVYINNTSAGGTFTMTGGSITNNTSYSNNNVASTIETYPTGTTFNMSGGTISGNHGGQWAIEIKNNFNLSGTYDISGNTKSDNTAACDIYCNSNSRITITDPISPVHPSTVGTSQTVLTNGWSTHMGNTALATCFTPFESNKALVVADGEVCYGTPVESIEVDPDETEMIVGNTYTILYTVLPADATNTALTFTSSDESVATVDEDGDVTGVAAGTAIITIAATDGSGVTGTFTVTVTNIDVEDIYADDITIIAGATATINYTVMPSNATDKSVTFTSANTAIATVDANGVVTGKGVGETTITIASVQNPEVTFDITVTVTSNPNAVQFTLSIDKTVAVPGDVITVEAYLNAPVNGNYNGFTGLVLGLHFDPTAFEVNGDPVKGTVANASTSAMTELPNETHPDLVQCSCAMSEGTNTTIGLVFTVQFTVLTEVELGSYTFYAEPTTAANFVCNLGSSPSPILYEYVPSTVEVGYFYTKDIEAYDPSANPINGWYLIASPLVAAVAPTDVANMTNETFDLYYFDQTGGNNGKEWKNWKDEEGDGYHFNLESGKGYLYANSEDVTLSFTGTPYSGDGQVTLVKDDDADLSGWNLVGNPFTVNAYILDGHSFYIMNDQGSEIIAASEVDRNYIKPMEGIFVVAKEDADVMTFTTEEPTGSPSPTLVINVNQTVTNRGGTTTAVIDRTIVRFDEGHQLPKLQIFENSTKLYIPQDNKEYAIVSVGRDAMHCVSTEIPVNFKAKENGEYTLTISSPFTSHLSPFTYLHLIDNITGADIDLLATNGGGDVKHYVPTTYTFTAKTTDYESRFKLLFSAIGGTNDDDEAFAFINNGQIILTGVGTCDASLQIIDMLGRIILTREVTPNSSLLTPNSPGVYVLRLINGENVKTQKIIIN